MPELHSVFNSSSSVVVSKGFVWVSHCSRIWEKSARNFPLKNASKFSTFFWNRTIQISYNFGFVTGDRLKLLSMAFISTLFFPFLRAVCSFFNQVVLAEKWIFEDLFRNWCPFFLLEKNFWIFILHTYLSSYRCVCVIETIEVKFHSYILLVCTYLFR